jgi:hypothetical protein
VSAERRAKIVAAYRQKLIAVKKKRQLKEAKRFMVLGYFDSGRIPDPKAWLEKRVGLLKVYREGGLRFGETEDGL